MSSLAQLTFGRYFPTTSFVHSMDPRYKLILTIFFGTMLLSMNSYIGLMLMIAPIAAATVTSTIPFSWMLRSVKPFIYVFVFTFFIHIFFTGGPALVDIGLLQISRDGFIEGAFVDLRLFLLIVGASVLTLSTSPTGLTAAIESLLRPLKVVRLPVGEIALMISIALAFIPLLIAESDKIIKAQICRGVDFSAGSLVKRAKNMVPIVIPLFFRMFKLSSDLSTAMESRCYEVGRDRTRFKELTGNKFDLIVTAILTLYILAAYFVSR